MNKNFKFYLSIWSILFAIFNIISFVTPNEFAGTSKFTGSFWIGYIFITLAFLGQLVVAYFVFTAEKTQKLFYKIPLISISWTGLVLTLIFGSICMAIPMLPYWIGIIACIIVLGFTAISLFKANHAAEIVSEVDEKIKGHTAFIKTLLVDAEILLSRATNEKIKSECKKVYEVVRFSDPMSHKMLASTETQITIKFSELSSAVNDNNIDLVKTIAREIVILVDERNKKCRLMK